jgi:hypothetical protein
MTTIPSKTEFLAKNWEGENRWRRSELENILNELNLELYEEDTNRDIFERILIEMIKINEKEEIKKIMLSNPKIEELYYAFMEQLPNAEEMIHNWQDSNEELNYEFFVKHNSDNFFLQDKPSFDFLKYFLENRIYKIQEKNTLAKKTKYIFFLPNGKYTIM